MTTEMKVSGKVVAVIFTASDSLYKVLRVKVSHASFTWNQTSITVVGQLDDQVAYDKTNSYEFSGELVTSKYGQQLKAASWRPLLPSHKQTAERFLASDDFKGIGLTTAKKIVATLGESALQQLAADVDAALAQLTDVKLTAAQQATLRDGFAKFQSQTKYMLKLVNMGFSRERASFICKQYKNIGQLLSTNPYLLCQDNSMATFNHIDNYAQNTPQLNFSATDPRRLQAAFMAVVNHYCLFAAATCMPVNDAVTQTVQLLHLGADGNNRVVDAVNELVHANVIYVDENNVALHNYIAAEMQIAQRVSTMVAQPRKKIAASKLTAALKSVQRKTSIEYGDQQLEALTAALQHQFFILTGGPGTGKTTIVNAFVHLFAQLHDVDLSKLEQGKAVGADSEIVLAAPTGRAAKRLSEATGLAAATIHSVLKLGPGYAYSAFGAKINDDVQTNLVGKEKTQAELLAANDPDDDDSNITAKLMIIDESSMVDTFMMGVIMQRLSPHTHILLVGDQDQLPSVGAGQVLADLLANPNVAHCQLTQVYRQSNTSTIVPLANAVNQGMLPADFTEKQADRAFIPVAANQIPEAIKQVVASAKKHGFAADDIQVLAPMHSGVAGTRVINQTLQQFLNPLTDESSEELTIRNETFRIGDRVLNLINDPAKRIYNGDIGRVIGFQAHARKPKKGELDNLTDEERKQKSELLKPHIIVNFDGKEVVYTNEKWDNLTLAYCMTIHKSQGSEFPVVILPMVENFARMFARNLLYTAITRAKKKLILLGETRAFLRCAQETVGLRATLLPYLLNLLLKDKTQPTEPEENKPASSTTTLNETQAPVAQPLAAVTPVAPGQRQTQILQLTAQMAYSRQIDARVGMDPAITPASFMISKGS